jgi:hypothetical protein
MKIPIKMNKTLIGVILGLLFASILIFSMNSGLNILQMSIGFLVYLIPSIFLSSFQSRKMSFTLTVFTALFTYVSFKYNYTDVWAGVLLALIIGLPLFYIKISKIK